MDRARVVVVRGSVVWVELIHKARGQQFGPCEVYTDQPLAPGAEVIVGRIGGISDDLVILGILVGGGGGGGGSGGDGVSLTVAAIVTAAGALRPGAHNPVDATAGALTMSLPTGSPGGTELSVEKIDASTNPVSVSGSIRGSVGTTALVLIYQFDRLRFVADANGSWWPTADGRTLTAIDTEVRSVLRADLADIDSALNAQLARNYLTLGSATDLVRSVLRADLADIDSALNAQLERNYLTLGSATEFGLAARETYKPADTARASTTTFAADPDLLLDLQPNTLYRLGGTLFLQADTALDFKCRWSVPASTTMKWRLSAPQVAAGGTIANSDWALLNADGIAVVGGTGQTTSFIARFEGLVNTGADPGTLKLQWAQNSAGTFATTLFNGSYISLTKVGPALAAPKPIVSGTDTPQSFSNLSEFELETNTVRIQSPNKSWSYAAVTDAISQTGASYSRHEVRSGDQWTDGRERCELRWMKHGAAAGFLPFETDIWIAYSFRWNGALPTGSYNIMNQMNQGPDPVDVTPRRAAVFGINLQPGGMNVFYRGERAYEGVTNPDPTTAINMSVPAVNTWTNMVFRLRLSRQTANGQLQVWRNGVQQVNLSGLVNAYNDDNGPYFKAGIYRGGTTETTIMEFANPEIGLASLLDRVTTPLALPNLPA